MDNENEIIEDTTDEIGEILEEVEETDNTDWKAEAEKARGIAQRLKTKLEKANKPKEEKVEKPVPVVKEAKTGELDEVESLLLEVKGIQDQDEVDLYDKWKADTGRNGRQILSNSIFQKELEALRAEKAVKDATPGSTRRSGASASDSLELALAKFEQTGKYPDDFELRAKVVNHLADKSNQNKPSWH